MKDLPVRITTSQFAAIHKLNKRTLHYYDEIGLFSPKVKGENGYRYYELSQSVELENILMLKELNMSIEEIRNYLKAPSSQVFAALADTKLEQLECEIKRLQHTKKILSRKRQQLLLCSTIKDSQISIVEAPREYLLISGPLCGEWNVETLMKHLGQAWDMTQYKVGCGSYISLKKPANKKSRLN
ncbi:MAG: MerR family transcriptional regulator [Eubacteriales bacterium]|nr:MerR family transcriptional regulator [Eubacteriales bacterium]